MSKDRVISENISRDYTILAPQGKGMFFRKENVMANIHKFTGKHWRECPKDTKSVDEYLFVDVSWRPFGEIVKTFAKSRLWDGGNGEVVIYDFIRHISENISFRWTDSDDSVWGTMCGHTGWLSPTQLRRLAAGLNS